MIPLPRSEYATPAGSRPWLLGALAAVLAGEILIIRFGSRIGWDYDVLCALRGAVALAVLAPLVFCRRITRLDVGLAVGRPGVTFAWVLFPAALATAVTVVVGALSIPVVRLLGLKVSIGPTDIQDAARAGEWFFTACLITPPVEELIYRGVLVGALDDARRRWIAVVGSGTAFAALHWLYGRPLPAMVEYFGAGAVMAWAFLRSRSLLAPILLHALGNVFVGVKDLFLLAHPCFFDPLFGSR
jgi:membrane protease YdiL (CAAX protease family)